MLETDANLPRGDGHAVLVFPGLGASGAATSAMRHRLDHLGYATYDWEHGINQGYGKNFNQWMAALDRQLLRLHDAHASSVSLLGWSLGGVYARELAKRQPRLVRQVITMATPFGARANTTNAGKIISVFRGDPQLVDAHLERQLAIAPPVHSTSIYSHTDGVVAWQACIGEETALHRNIEVSGVSHLGMTHHPQVLREVANALARKL
jgi:esterase/lipase